MIMCGVCCGCSGMNIRDVYGLVLILDIGMNRYLYALILHRLKCHYGCSGNCGCVKLEYDFYTSLRLLSGEGGACSYLLTINQDWLFSLLIHQGSSNRILFSWQQ